MMTVSGIVYAAQTKMERSVLNITYKDRRTNMWVRERTKVMDIISSERKMKWSWAGHINCLKHDWWNSHVTTWRPYDKKRRQGRPTKRWRDSSSSSRSHWVVGSLRQTQFSCSQLCHGLRFSSFRWLSCLDWYSPSISASVFLFFVSQVVPSPESFFRRIIGLASLRGQTTSVLLSCTSLSRTLRSVSPWCHRFSQGLLVCGRMPICTSSFLSLPVSSRGS